MALLELLNVEGDSQEESATVTETWYCEYSAWLTGILWIILLWGCLGVLTVPISAPL